jgi:hypothetical protein
MIYYEGQWKTTMTQSRQDYKRPKPSRNKDLSRLPGKEPYPGEVLAKGKGNSEQAEGKGYRYQL